MTSARLAIADLRDSWSAWVAVSLTFIVTSAAIALSSLVLNSGARATGLEEDYRGLLMFEGSINVGLCSIVALIVVSSSTSLVVASRRGGIARLLLAGAAPGQVVRMLLLQLVIVTLVCSVIGDAVALLSQGSVLHILAGDRGFDAPGAVSSTSVLLASSLYCAAVAVIGGLREARRATKIPPVEALRSSAGAAPASTSRVALVLRWSGCILLGGLIVAGVAIFQVVADQLGREGLQTIMQIAVFSLPIIGLAFSLVATSVVGPLTRLWTSLIPLRGPTWHLARHSVVARADRLVKSVLPVMFTVGLLFGMMALVDSVNATLSANNAGFELDGSSFVTMVSLMGLSIAIALAGSVGNLMMMTRQRDAELALGGVVGATPRQQVLLPALEATMVTGTAALMGLAMAGVGIGVIAFGMPYAVPKSAVSMPIGLFFWILLATWLITLAATVLPSLPSLRRPAPRVIACLIAS